MTLCDTHPQPSPTTSPELNHQRERDNRPDKRPSGPYAQTPRRNQFVKHSVKPPGRAQPPSNTPSNSTTTQPPPQFSTNYSYDPGIGCATIPS